MFRLNKGRIAPVFPLGILMLWAGPGCAAETAAPTDMKTDTKTNTVFREDFEGENSRLPVPWASNVTDAKINFAGVTNEHAFTGKKSYKLDVTLNGGSYYYYWLPVRVPFWSPLKFRGRMLQQENAGENGPRVVQMGFGWGMPSAGQSGNVVMAKKIGLDENGWQEWDADASAFVGSSETAHIEGLAVYIFSSPGGFKNTRATLYLDDFEIEGDLPAGYEQKLDGLLKTLAETQQHELVQMSQRWRQRANTVLLQIQPATPVKLPDWAALQRDRLQEFVRESSAQVRDDAGLCESAPDNAVIERLKKSLPLLEVAVRSLSAWPEYSRRHGAQPYYSSIVNPIQDLRILPDSFPLAAVPGAQIQIEAAAGEYEPASFAITALQDLKQVKLNIAPLQREGGKQAGSTPSVDARLVKVWWQAGFAHDDVKHPQLTPELLLHDDKFVTVNPDPKLHLNTLKDAAAPRDAATLQPLDIPAGKHQQFWLTIHVPENTPGGMYKTTITVTPANAEPMELSLQVRVYPFRLAEPMTENAIYYTGRLSPDGAPHISADLKSEGQFRAELRDMKAHGVTLPSDYTPFLVQPDGTFDFAPLQRVLEIYREEGLTKGPHILVSPLPFYEIAGKDEAGKKQLLEKARHMTQALEAFRKQHNYPQFAVYGIDEAVGEILQSQNEMFRVINENGGMISEAVGPGFFAAVGNWLNRPIIAGGQPEIYPAVHAKGYKVWIYARPMVGVEAPELYRRSYGLMLWKQGEDGAAPYAYQASEDGDLYDEFGNASYRSMDFTYPTIDGVLDTVQWEGHREGIDDVRYLTTLLQRIEAAKKDNKIRAKLAQDAETWLAQVDIEGDLQAIRRRMAQWIIKLQ